ncbi:MAG: hypothetical protein IPJ84_17890 [Bdellovibrionales bacterium]|nr:hypothetical protein [Bdellovibrionales bacterium]
MKKQVLMAIACVVGAGSIAHSAEAKYVNDSGCSVIAENTANGTLYYVQKDGETSLTIGVTKDLKSADFAYCSQDVIEIHSLSGAGGTRIMISCSEHQNDHGVTRGQVDIDLDSAGGVRSISIDGQVKGLLGFWKKEAKIVCNDLESKK